MAGTLIAAVRLAVLSGVAGLPEFFEDDVTVSVRWPLGAKAAEMVFTDGPAQFHHEPASLKSGRTFRDERATFNVVIRVEGIDASQEDTTDRVIVLGTAFEEFVADNRTELAADVPGLNWIVISGDGQLEELWNEQGTLALLTYPVTYDARLT